MPEHYRVVLNGEFPRERYLSGFAGAGHHGVIRYSRMHTDFGARSPESVQDIPA